MTLRGLDAALAVDVGVLWGLYRLSVLSGWGEQGRPGRRGPCRSDAGSPAGLRGMLKRASCERFRLRLALGTGDAASTGVLVGAAWAIAGLIVSLAKASVGRWRCVPSVSIEPSFYSRVLEGDFECALVLPAWQAAWGVAGIAVSKARRCCGRGAEAAG